MGLLESLGLPPLSVPSASPPSLAPPSTGSSDSGRPSDALDGKLGTELDALVAVLDGIHDDAAAKPLRDVVQKVIDGRATAAAMAEQKRVVALNALLASVHKQRPAADAALKHDQAVTSHEAARKEIEVALGQVTALVLGGINDDGLRKAIDAPLVKAQADFAKASRIAELVQGEKALLAMKPSVLALLAKAEDAKSTTDWLVDVWKPLVASAKVAVAGIGLAAPRAGLEAEIAGLEASVPPRVAASDLATLKGTSEPALKAIQAKAVQIVAFEKESAAIQAQVAEAEAFRGSSTALLTAAVNSAFGNAKAAVERAVAASDWVSARAAVATLKTAAAAVVKTRNDYQAYDKEMRGLAADRAKVLSLRGTPGLPTKATAAYDAGFAPLNAAETSKNWVAALAAIPGFKKGLKEALDALADGKKFYSVYEAVRPDNEHARQLVYETNNQVQTDEKLSAAGSHYEHFRELMDKAVAASDWSKAKDVLADVQVAAREFIAVAASNAAARKPYDDALAAMPGRRDAELLAETPTPPYAASLQAYVKQRQIVYGAADDSDFARAIAGLPALQATIDAVVAVKGAQTTAKTAFDAAWGKGDYPEALQVAAAKVAVLAEPIKAFTAADAAVELPRKIPDYVAANAALPALVTASSTLVQAKAAFNGAATPADSAAFDAKLKALEPRTGRASDAPVPPFIDVLQKAVTDRLAAITAATSANPKDLAAAEAGLSLLLTDLDKMEQAKGKLAAHQARFDAVKNGDVKVALSVPLTPPALAAERAAAVAKTEASIAAQAAAGDLEGADARLAGWALEARGWQQTQQAFAELHNGRVPSVDVLATLAKQPGGDQALDDLIMNMPPNTPAKVLGAALKARFGFEVKRLETMNGDIQNLAGLKGHDPDHQDPELVAMYKLLSQIPSQRIKGKITELVDFDANDGGGVYYGGGEKKIYVHAGAVGDASSPHQFAGPDEILPKGEKVQEDCKPNPKAPPMPQADHTLLHETAHAEDDGIKFMDKHMGQPEFGNWREESPSSIAKVAAAHLHYDEDWIEDTLNDKGSKPPAKTPKPPKGVTPDEWEKRRQAALLWCQSIRADNNPWWKGAVCARIQIGGRVYQEAYADGRWRSYDYAARSRGISGYQFRAPAEWFAELYAAYFGGKLKDSHPAMSWLKQFQPRKT